MEFVLIGRGERVARLRQVTEHKLGRLERIEPRITRLEVEVIAEKNPRRGGLHRVEAVAAAPRKSYRAHAEAKDVESALDVVVERLERQIRDHHERRLARRNAGAGRVRFGPAARQDRRARSQERGVTDKADTGTADTGKVDGAETGSEKLRVLVCDDHALFRRGLKMVLDEEPDLELVGEASDGAEVVVRAQELMPDVILMDVRMPKRSGIEAAGEIKDSLPHVKILMLTISDDEADLYEAIKAGASGYLLKEIPIEEVADAIRSVWAGQSRISPSMASKLLTEFAAMSKSSDQKPQMPAPRLTDREMEVLRLVAQGLNNRDIAGKLFISENTVKNHIRNILEKLHLHSRMEAVVYAVREKMIEIT
jgi:ribosomal subunit interface protein